MTDNKRVHAHQTDIVVVGCVPAAADLGRNTRLVLANIRVALPRFDMEPQRERNTNVFFNKTEVFSVFSLER
jgi:hypothetical protein